MLKLKIINRWHLVNWYLISLEYVCVCIGVGGGLISVIFIIGPT